MFYEYAAGAAWDGVTAEQNESDFTKIKLRQRVAVDLNNRSLKSTMLGQPVSMPVALAPIGLLGMQSADGEIKAARAAHRFGIPFCLSMMSIASVEDIAENVGQPFWLQLYLTRDASFIEQLVERAKAAKVSALVLTMDRQVQGERHNERRNGLSAPPKFTAKHIWQMAMRPSWALGMLGTRRHTFRNIQGHVPGLTDLAKFSNWADGQFDIPLAWHHLEWVKKLYGGKVILKGVLDAEDARLAVEHGADAIVVSNHGGRQLDGVPSTIRVLPEIVDAVAGKTEVYLDSGIRSGQDVLKSLALGADGVLIGRSFVYGLAAGGEAGVTRALDIIAKELDITMALCGERDVKNLGLHNIYSNDLIARQGY
jgi:L-lactate dehydrogenase (cytochrome)